MLPERFEVDCAGLDDGELYGLRQMVLWMAAELDTVTEAQRLFLLELGERLGALRMLREVAWWRLDEELLDPGGPVRLWYPPGHRQPDEPAYGL